MGDEAEYLMDAQMKEEAKAKRPAKPKSLIAKLKAAKSPLKHADYQWNAAMNRAIAIVREHNAGKGKGA